MQIGNEIKDYLSSHLSEIQKSKSSHWQKYLDSFYVDNNFTFEGLQGFGLITQGSRITQYYHQIMQLPFRRIGRSYNSFNSALEKAKEIAKKQNRLIDLDILRQTLTIAFIQEALPNFTKDDNRYCVVIGDGFGVLSSLILKTTNHRVISINLSEVLLVDYIYTRNIVSNESTVLINEEEDVERVLTNPISRLIYIQADNLGLLKKMPIYVSFNINSMQEMDPHVIAEYFKVLRECKSKSLHFYCCNRIHKTLPDGTQTSFFDYPWLERDEFIIDELCPWNQYFYSTKYPFYHNYDGPTQHRLAKFNNH